MTIERNDQKVSWATKLGMTQVWDDAGKRRVRLTVDRRPTPT